jgi:hypothetical protein
VPPPPAKAFAIHFVSFALHLEKASPLAPVFSQTVEGSSNGFEESALAFETSSLVVEGLSSAAESASIAFAAAPGTAKCLTQLIFG